MFTKKSNNNWLKMSSAVLGGFLLGFSYKRYGKGLEHQIRRITKRPLLDPEDYTHSLETDI